jgi:hypothetical protein
MSVIKKDDVVYLEGASAILGDVLNVTDDGIEIAWRATVTTELAGDLVVVADPPPRLRPEERP